jgi:hypothetical protein
MIFSARPWPSIFLHNEMRRLNNTTCLSQLLVNNRLLALGQTPRRPAFDLHLSRCHHVTSPPISLHPKTILPFLLIHHPTAANRGDEGLLQAGGVSRVRRARVGFVIWIWIWCKDVWGIGTQEVGIPASNYGEEVWNVSSYEREAAFDLRDSGMDVEIVVLTLSGVYELIGEDEAGYAYCCDAGEGEMVSLGLKDRWG